MVAWHEVPGKPAKAAAVPEGRYERCLRFTNLNTSLVIFRRCPRIIPSLIGGPKLFIDLGPKPPKRALERERAQIVNNFAQGASATTNNRPLR